MRICLNPVIRLIGIFLFAAISTATAQTITDSGSIVVIVSDTSGGRVQNASVTVSRVDRSTDVSMATDDDGTCRFSVLQPGLYRVSVDAAGFAPVESQLEVHVGTVESLQLQLPLGAETISITVTETRLDSERTQQAEVLEPVHIEMLPINQRNYLDFALLAPGVMDSTFIADGLDLRIPVLQNSGLSFSGGNGRGNVFAIDGIQNAGFVGNVRPALPQEAVQEFIVERNAYSAQIGGGYGGAVSIVSKSAGNDFHGAVFGYLRHRSLQARNYFDPAKSAFTREQSGASGGAALIKNRLFYFAAFERLDRHESGFVSLLQDRTQFDRVTPSQDALLSYMAGNSQTRDLANLLQGILRPESNPIVAPLYERNSGVFPFAADESSFSNRWDWRRSAAHSMMLRVNASSENSENTRFGALVGYSRGTSNKFRDGTVVLTNTVSLASRWLSVTRAATGYTGFSGLPNDPVSPELNIEGSGFFGRDSQFPYHRQELHTEFEQAFKYAARRHIVNFGGDINPIRGQLEVLPWNGGRFEFGSAIPLSVLMDSVTGDPNFSSNLASTLAGSGRSDLITNVSDPLTSLQSFSLNLPVAYFQSFGDPHYSGWQGRYSAFVEDAWQLMRGVHAELGYRFQGESNRDMKFLANHEPRIGLSWSPGSDGRWVVRSGFGLFHNFSEETIPYSAYGFKTPAIHVVLIPLTGDPRVINPNTGQPVNSADIYGGLVANGVIGKRQIQFSDLAQFGISPAYRSPTTGDLAADFRSAYSRQASLEVERGFKSLAWSVGYNFSRTSHLPRVRDYNLIKVGTLPDGWPIFGQIDPTILNNFVVESTGNSIYHALSMKASGHIGTKWSGIAHYTFSKAIDDVTDFGFDFAPHNQADIRAERAPSLFNAKHRFVGTLTFETASCGAGSRVCAFRDWSASMIARANSSRPFNVLTGFDDIGDGLVNTHRPLGLGRNRGIGPDFFSLDARVSKAIPLGSSERLKLHITAEMFNVMNRTNFLSVNNVVGATPVQALGNRITGNRGNPTEPLSFTSALDARQAQVSARLSF